jgi:uncharacterized protein with FMN-binding domain
MRRTLPVLAATGGGLALLANFHTSQTATAVTAGATGAGISTPPPTTQAAPAGRTSSTSSTTTTAPQGGTRTIDGPVSSNDYGDVQVRVVLQGTKIVDVQALTLPSDRARSARISDYAGPILRREALQAQNARIDLVSGATYTSESYQESLQGALDRAR